MVRSSPQVRSQVCSLGTPLLWTPRGLPRSWTLASPATVGPLAGMDPRGPSCCGRCRVSSPWFPRGTDEGRSSPNVARGSWLEATTEVWTVSCWVPPCAAQGCRGDGPLEHPVGCTGPGTLNPRKLYTLRVNGSVSPGPGVGGALGTEVSKWRIH